MTTKQLTLQAIDSAYQKQVEKLFDVFNFDYSELDALLAATNGLKKVQKTRKAMIALLETIPND